jgi:hypothetical protein
MRAAGLSPAPEASDSATPVALTPLAVDVLLGRATEPKFSFTLADGSPYPHDAAGTFVSPLSGAPARLT